MLRYVADLTDNMIVLFVYLRRSRVGYNAGFSTPKVDALIGYYRIESTVKSAMMPTMSAI